MIEALQTSHTLQQRYQFSLTELYAMTPWEVDVRIQLILQDQERQKEQAARP